MSVANSLIQGAQDALAIAKGDLEPAAIFIPESVDVAGIRKRLKLSQQGFADRFGLHVGTVRDWEQLRRTPDRAAVVLLSVIDRNPELVAEALAHR